MGLRCLSYWMPALFVSVCINVPKFLEARVVHTVSYNDRRVTEVHNFSCFRFKKKKKKIVINLARTYESYNVMENHVSEARIFSKDTQTDR